MAELEAIISATDIRYLDNAEFNEAVKTYSDSLEARVDNLATLEEGSTTGDAELIDGRVGADGKTYTNIGGAIRGQISELKEDLVDYKKLNCYNLYDLWEHYITSNGITYTKNGASITANGTATANSYYTYVNSENALPFGVEVGKSYKCIFTTSNNNIVFEPRYYKTDASGTYILPIVDNEITIPSNTKGLLFRVKIAKSIVVSDDVFALTLLNTKTNKELTNSINELTDGIDELKRNKIPKYWFDYLDNKHSDLINADMSIGFNGISFSYITDMHWRYNYKKSPLLIDWIQKNTSNKLCVFGGDLLSNRSTRVEALEDISNYKYIAKDTNIDFIFGNHDLDTNGKTSDHFTEAEYHAFFQKHNNVNWAKNTLCGYRDFANEKIRFIYWDYAKLDYTLLNNWVTELSSEWSVLVFTHIIYNPTSASESNVAYHSTYGTPFVNNIDSIYDTVNANIIGIVTGHLHRDYSSVTTKGVRIIATTCDAGYSQASNYDNVNPTRTDGTTTEQAFDLFYINTDTRKIKIVRIGAGDTSSDREFTY